MRVFSILASLVTTLLTATGVSAQSPATRATDKATGQSDKPINVSQDIDASQVETTITRLPESARAAGVKASADRPAMIHVDERTAPIRGLGALTRLTGLRTPKRLTAGEQRRSTPVADLPASIVERQFTAAPKTAGAKNLRTSGDAPAIQAAGDKRSQARDNH